MSIKAIETFYNGYKFRSRLEARWAVFFDNAGIEYQYEPQGFDLGSGIYYLPDFYLPNVELRNGGVGLYVEVKGVMTEEDLYKIEKFSNTTIVDNGYGGWPDVENPILIVGEIPDIIGGEPRPKEDAYNKERYWNFEFIDGDYYQAWFSHLDDGTILVEGYDNHDGSFSWFNEAYDKARQARFEHGENGGCKNEII